MFARILFASICAIGLAFPLSAGTGASTSEGTAIGSRPACCLTLNDCCRGGRSCCR